MNDTLPSVCVADKPHELRPWSMHMYGVYSYSSSSTSVAARRKHVILPRCRELVLLQGKLDSTFLINLPVRLPESLDGK